MPPKQSAKLSEVKPRGKNGLELGPPSERDRSQSRERRKKKTARLELVAEVPDEQELETTLDEAEEVDNKFRSEADALLEDIEQRKVARRNRMIQDKLDEINGRVETTLGNYEAAGAEEMGGAQFVKDMQELMEVATDAVKKRKYMRDVSVFIVGFTSACEQRLNILEQLDVFFKEQEKQPEIEHKMGETDFDSISKSVEEALEFAQGSMGKLGDLNKEIIVAVENAVTARERAKGNQRLKKQLDKAKEDIQQLTDKLVEVQAELDEKLQEMKRVQRQNEELKIHAERAKKLAEDLKVLDNVEDIREKALEVDMMKEELKSVQAELSQKDAIISGLQEEIQRLEEEKDAIREELLSVISVKQDTIEALEEKVRDMELEHAREMDALKAEHEEQMESARLQFEQQMQEERELMAQHSANLQSELDETKSQFEQLQAEAKTMSEELDLLKNKKVQFNLNSEEEKINQEATNFPKKEVSFVAKKLFVTKGIQCSIQRPNRNALTQTLNNSKSAVNVAAMTQKLVEIEIQEGGGRFSTETASGNILFTPRKPRMLSIPGTVRESSSKNVLERRASVTIGEEPEDEEMEDIQLAAAEERAKKLDKVASNLDARMQDIAAEFSYEQFASSRRKISSSDENVQKNFSQMVEDFDHKPLDESFTSKGKSTPRRKGIVKKKSGLAAVDKNNKRVFQLTTKENSTLDPPLEEEPMKEAEKPDEEGKDRNISEPLAVDEKGERKLPIENENPTDWDQRERRQEGGFTTETIDADPDQTNVENNGPNNDAETNQSEADQVPEMVQSESTKLNREPTLKLQTEASGLSTISGATNDDVIPSSPMASLHVPPFHVTVEPTGAQKGRGDHMDLKPAAGRGVADVKRDVYSKSSFAEYKSAREAKKSLFKEEPLAVRGERLGDPEYDYQLTKWKLRSQQFHNDQSNVAEDELRARYNQYRKLAITHITQLEEKVESNKELEKQLSEKFYQMEKQWNAERQLLMEQAERSESGRKEAEAEAEQTLHQLETFLHDMEKLHKMRDYTRLEARHFRKLDEDMQDQYMKTLSPYAQEALRQQLNEGPGDANFAMQTEEVINEAKRGINGLRAGSRRSQRSAEAQIMMKSVRNMRRYHSSMTPFTVDSFFDLSEIEKADPMLSEYLRAYDFVHEFKSTVAFLFKNKAVDSVVTILDEIEFISFDQDENCFQQISEMQQQLIILLGEILGVLLRILFQNKLDHRTLQYFQKQLPDLVPRSLYAHMDDSVLSGGAELKRLQDEVAALKSDFESQRRELEDKIGKLESDYGANKEQLRQLMIRLEESENKLAEFEAQRSAILFTRMDAERNYRNLKKAIQYDKIDTDTFEKATHLIDKYTSLPGQRLMTMVKRYSAHCSMRLLEENIRRMTGNRGAHIQLIHNFEQFQHKRDSQWRAVSAGLAAQRQEAAEKLTKDLEQIEQQSSGSIFLIKPMFSYKAKLRKKTDGSGKYLTEMELTDVSESKPPPQPPTTHQPHKKRLAALPPKVLDPQFVPEPPMGTDRPFLPMTNIYETESGYVNNEMTGAGLMAVDYTQVPTWKKMDSVAENVIEDNMLLSSPHHAWNTPKMLELDINRFMMDHNSIMSPVRTLGSSGRAKHPRSYLSVSRTIPQDALTPKARGKTQPDSPKLVLGSDGHQRLPPITNNS
ncbi:centromere-associated protein E-like isoform X3 [Symsagittifera roscoffensis]|uniref:centromere-associated protein E-like isoform X3 n=1 Tax=Symsagittifera roscoffensis TaxID=84072 RepID=UPI00307C5F9F